MSDRARVAVLLATHQGEQYLEEQLATLLGQQDVDIRIAVSDDASTDGTGAILAAHADDPRITVLPADRFGSPQRNFLRLVREADVQAVDFVALADQDDRWHLDKLARQTALLRRIGADAVSSDVVAFWGDGPVPAKTQVLRKSEAQREFDFLLESAGPGCTFLVAIDAFTVIREIVSDGRLVDDRVPHDWLIYAIVRATGRRWHIDTEPTLDYRQHGHNATGANVGLRQAALRARRLASGDYRKQCAAVAATSAQLAGGTLGARLAELAPLLQRTDFRARLALLRLAPELRREQMERWMLRVALLLGIW